MEEEEEEVRIFKDCIVAYFVGGDSFLSTTAADRGCLEAGEATKPIYGTCRSATYL